MTECQKAYFCQSGKGRWHLCDFGCMRNNHWFVMHHANRCMLEKRHQFCILSNHWDTLSFCRRRDGEMKVLLLSTVLGLLYAGLGEAQLVLVPVPGVVQAGRRSWGLCVCVCPFWGLVMWIPKSGHLPTTQSCSIPSLYTCSAWPPCHLRHLFIGCHACSLLLWNRRITQPLD